MGEVRGEQGSSLLLSRLGIAQEQESLSLARSSQSPVGGWIVRPRNAVYFEDRLRAFEVDMSD